MGKGRPSPAATRRPVSSLPEARRLSRACSRAPDARLVTAAPGHTLNSPLGGASKRRGKPRWTAERLVEGLRP